MKVKLVVIMLLAFVFQACPPKHMPIMMNVNLRFEKEILAFEQQDKNNGIIKDEILFVGSSSIRMWTTLTEDMHPMKVLNRGFGGATTPEVIQYFDRIIKPYTPEIVVIYVGENDIAEKESAENVFYSNKRLIEQIEAEFKTVQIVYISMKPSIARWEMWKEFKEGNELIKDWINTKDNCHYLETAEVMLNEDGSIRKEIFIEDGLHMNAIGYESWTKMIKPILEELKNKN